MDLLKYAKTYHLFFFRDDSNSRERQVRPKWLKNFPFDFRRSKLKNGGFADTSPVMITTRASMKEVKAKMSEVGLGELDERRFRQNAIIAVDEDEAFQVRRRKHWHISILIQV